MSLLHKEKEESDQKEEGDHIGPVSYTHLDVYKRQGIDNGIGELKGAFSAILPMPGESDSGSGFLCHTAHQFDLIISIGMESVDTHHRVDPGLLDGPDMMNQVFAPLLHPVKLFRSVSRVQRLARKRQRSTPMGLECTNRSHNNGTVGLQPRHATFKVPELLKSDIGGKAGFCNHIFTQFKSDTIRNNRGLPDSNVGKRCV